MERRTGIARKAADKRWGGPKKTKDPWLTQQLRIEATVHFEMVTHPLYEGVPLEFHIGLPGAIHPQCPQHVMGQIEAE